VKEGQMVATLKSKDHTFNIWRASYGPMNITYFHACLVAYILTNIRYINTYIHTYIHTCIHACIDTSKDTNIFHTFYEHTNRYLSMILFVSLF
jgi:hypothetical protein